MTKKPDAVSQPLENSPTPTGDYNQRGLVLRSLMPSKEVLTREVISKPKGTAYQAARIFGYVIETNAKSHISEEGIVSEIVSLGGVFRVEGAQRYSSITLTQAFSKTIAKRLEGKSILKVDVRVVLENTGVAGAPYKWVVLSDIPEEASDAMAVFAPASVKESA